MTLRRKSHVTADKKSCVLFEIQTDGTSVTAKITEICLIKNYGNAELPQSSVIITCLTVLSISSNVFMLFERIVCELKAKNMAEQC